MNYRLIVCLFFPLMASSLHAEDAISWITKNSTPINKGTTEWTVILTTGHFGLDPQLATATRAVCAEIVGRVGAKGDKVRILAAEMSIWGRPKITAIENFTADLPTTPSPNSLGGRDIEGVLAEAAKEANGSILLLAPGESQLPTSGIGKLHGGEVSIDGFEPVKRGEIDVNTPSGTRKLLAYFLQSQHAAVGESSRQKLIEIAPKATLETAKDQRTQQRQVSQVNYTLMIGGGGLLFLSGLACGSLAIGKARRGTGEEVTANPHTSEELEQWKESARLQRKQLDLISQELAETVAKQSEAVEGADIELRQEIASQKRTLSIWDETAIDFLDGLGRAMENNGLSESEVITLRKSQKQFLRLAQRTGLDTISPEPGDEILDGLHRIEGTLAPDEAAPSGHVNALISPGYRRGDTIIRQAKVIISS